MAFVNNLEEFLCLITSKKMDVGDNARYAKGRLIITGPITISQIALFRKLAVNSILISDVGDDSQILADPEVFPSLSKLLIADSKAHLILKCLASFEKLSTLIVQDSGELPVRLSCPPNLEFLSLSDCGILEKISDCFKLQYLSLTNCQPSTDFFKNDFVFCLSSLDLQIHDFGACLNNFPIFPKLTNLAIHTTNFSLDEKLASALLNYCPVLLRLTITKSAIDNNANKLLISKGVNLQLSEA